LSLNCYDSLVLFWELRKIHFVEDLQKNPLIFRVQLHLDVVQSSFLWNHCLKVLELLKRGLLKQSANEVELYLYHLSIVTEFILFLENFAQLNVLSIFLNENFVIDIFNLDDDAIELIPLKSLNQLLFNNLIFFSCWASY